MKMEEFLGMPSRALKRIEKERRLMGRLPTSWKIQVQEDMQTKGVHERLREEEEQVWRDHLE